MTHKPCGMTRKPRPGGAGHRDKSCAPEAADPGDPDLACHHYRAGRLQIEDLDLARLAGETGTPVYCYGSAAITRAVSLMQDAFRGRRPQICFAVKANGNLSLLRLMHRLGLGADVVSQGEMQRALQAGMPADAIVFSGVGKSDGEIAAAIRAGIAHLNVESEAELRRITSLARQIGRKAQVMLRINPEIAVNTHAKIATGTAASKFGIAFDDGERLYRAASAEPALQLRGLAIHIGSQILQPQDFAAGFSRLRQLHDRLVATGLAVPRLDLGGGLGIDYGSDAAPDFAGHALQVQRHFGDLDVELVLEPGRALVARAGLLITKVIAVKPARQGHHVIIDAGMNDLLRPALYDARHRVIAVIRPDAEAARRGGAELARCQISGPVCESSDVMLRDALLPLPQPGDLLAILDTGAYGAVLSSTYNARPLIPEVLIDRDRFAVIRRRVMPHELFGLEPPAFWLCDHAAGSDAVAGSDPPRGPGALAGS